MKFLAAELLVKQVRLHTTLVEIKAICTLSCLIGLTWLSFLRQISDTINANVVKIGIYRNAQDHVVHESFSPKVKSMVDVWNHGKVGKQAFTIITIQCVFFFFLLKYKQLNRFEDFQGSPLYGCPFRQER